MKKKKGKTLRTHRENHVNRRLHIVTPPLESGTAEQPRTPRGGSFPSLCWESFLLPGQNICPGAGPMKRAHPSSVPSSTRKSLAALPHPQYPLPLSRQMEARTRLGNAARARWLPDNVNRAVGHGECCQALIRASCTARLSPRPWSCSPAPSLWGLCPSAAREKKLSWFASHTSNFGIQKE